MPIIDLTPREAYEASIIATSLAATGTALVDYSTEQAIDTLANYSYWKPAFASGFPTITYSFPIVDNDPTTTDEPADYIGNGRYGTLRSFSTEQAAAARLALAEWDDLIPLNFVDVGNDPNADMQFFNSTLINTAGGAPAGLGTDGDVWIYNYDVDPPATRDWSVGSFYFGYWMVHEVGHTLGLSHSGSYPGPGYGGLNYLQESSVYTVMSYNSNGDTGVVWAADMATPMVNDIAAVQFYYGADMTTRTGDTVYGFNSNVTDRLPYSFDAILALKGKFAPMTIWDAGGNDTLDLSKFAGNATIDLHEGGYSNAGGQEMAIGIAYGAVIENAIGGRGDDVIFGNAVANVLQGNDGNDRIYGGPETVSTVANPRDFIGVQMNLGGSARNQYLSETGITGLSGAQFTFEQMVKLAGAPTGLIAFASYNVSGNDNQFLLEGSGTIKLTIANKATYDTGISVQSLLDGVGHRLAVTWDKASGGVGVSIDGALVHTGTYTAAIGANIASGGSLVLGQEQDSPGGGFDTAQVFQGVMGDIRIFNDLRTAQEITDNAFTRLSGSEQGLVDNWQVSATDTTKVTDVAIANPPVDLTTLMPVGTFSVSQSSSYDASSGAAKVLDDNNATFNHTLNGGHEWLRMDFNQSLQVDYIQIVNRPSWGGRLDGATVSLLDAGGNVIYTSAAITGATDGGFINIMLPNEMSASAVRIDQTTNFLHIAELNVFGQAPAGLAIPSALLDTNLTIQNGAVVVDTAPAVLPPDNDTLIGGAGSDTLHGGAGNDQLIGDGNFTPRPDVLGLALNNGGVTGQSLKVSNLAGLPQTGITVAFEVLFAAAPAYQWFAAAPGLSLLFDPSNTGAPGLWVLLNGSWTYSGISVATLGDGHPHQIAFTWDSATGNFAHYLDGFAVKTGTGFQTGVNLSTSGIGNVTFNPVGGAIGDIRIYDHALSASEIQVGSASTLADPAHTTGLALNWVVAADGMVGDAAHGHAPTITGTPQVATLITTSYDDTLDGGAGDDTLTGGFGNDAIDGGDGMDTAVFDSPRGAYTFDYAPVSHILTITDWRSGSPDGTDTITNVELFQFAGATVSLQQLTNHAPTLATSVLDQSGTAAASFAFKLPADTFGDIDAGDTLTLTATLDGGAPLPTWLAFNATTGAFTGNPTHADVGTWHIAITATDTVGAIATDTFDLAIAAVPANGYVSIFNASVIEGDSGTTTLSFTVTHTGSTTAFDVDYATHDGIAMVEDNDYVATTGTLHFAAGTTSAVINVTVNGDTQNEGDQGFNLTLQNATNGVVLGNATGFGTILTDDTTPPASNVSISQSGITTHTGDADDMIGGSVGVDVIYGDGGDDTVFAGDGQDQAYGGDGGDTLVGNADIFAQEHDLLDGAAGDDTLYGEYTDNVTGGLGYDILYAVNSYGWSIDLGTASIEWMFAGFGDDQINASTQSASVQIYGSGGNDTITGSGFDDFLWAGVGNDTLIGGNGADMLFGDLGIDSLSGGGGDDLLYVDSIDTTIDGGSGFDAVYITSGPGMTFDMATQGIEWVADFANGNDVLNGATMTVDMTTFAGGGTDIITGGSGNDFLWGEADDDTISGGIGIDTLVGGTGADVLTGGGGIDNIYLNSGGGTDGALDRVVFTAGWGTDFVYDFVSGEDKLDLTALATDVASLTITNSSGHAYVTIGAGTDLIGVANNGGLLMETDFIF